ncbi:Delay of germination [Thalictrum thalictroides]|uniref:Delay of germination n=1 Tax=Thalictrum thalictroides TaxID=46969 RepID=A0A7J6WJ18_THATH|nr:Delay of germination [Thalictrum thalictroides]
MNFGRFYQVWLQHLQFLLNQLASSPKPKTDEDQNYLNQLIKRVMTHYDDYYRVKTHAAKNDVFAVYNASWLTSLERALHWIAGWRPTTIFHLVYTESSARFEARLLDLLRGHKTGDLGDLSPTQLARVSELQCETVIKENEITTELGTWQASDIVSLLIDQEPEIERLVKVLAKADDLRLKTIKSVVDILTTQQAVEFLIAAAELQFGVHGWGLDKDQSRDNN